MVVVAPPIFQRQSCLVIRSSAEGPERIFIFDRRRDELRGRHPARRGGSVQHPDLPWVCPAHPARRLHRARSAPLRLSLGPAFALPTKADRPRQRCPPLARAEPVRQARAHDRQVRLLSVHLRTSRQLPHTVAQSATPRTPRPRSRTAFYSITCGSGGQGFVLGIDDARKTREPLISALAHCTSLAHGQVAAQWRQGRDFTDNKEIHSGTHHTKDPRHDKRYDI